MGKKTQDGANPQGGKSETAQAVEQTNQTAAPAESTNQQTEKRSPSERTVADIAAKHRRVTACLEKLESLDEAAKNLDSFHLGSGKMTDSLEIADGRGNRFQTTKTFLIEKVAALLKAEIEAKTLEVEAELKAIENE